MSVRNPGNGPLDGERESLLLSIILDDRRAEGITAPEAVTELLQGHRPSLERICWTWLRRQPGLVEDAMQDIAVALIDALRRKRARRQSIDDFGAYARVVAANTCRRYAESAQRAAVPLDGIETADASGFGDLFRRAWNGRALRLIDEAVEQLTPRTREIVRDLMLRELAGVPTETGGTASSIYKARSRGRHHVIAALRVRLRGELDSGSACDELHRLLDAAEGRRDETGRLPATSLEEIAEHLRQCPRCKDTERKRMFAALRALPFVLAPHAADRLDGRIRLVSARTFTSSAGAHRQPRPRPPARPSGRPRPQSPRPRRRHRGLTSLLVLLVLFGGALTLGRWSPAAREALPSLPALPGASPATEHERPVPQGSRPQPGRTPGSTHEPAKGEPTRKPRGQAQQKNEEPSNDQSRDPDPGQTSDNPKPPDTGQPPNDDQEPDGETAPPAPRTLTIEMDAGGGGDAIHYLDISVNGTPAGACNAPATCTFPVHDGDEVGYVHNPEPHENPAGNWTTGPCAGSPATEPCTFTITEDVTLHLLLPWP
ncbi:sigma factor [Actinomadura opuntiae]|uniref:sigma factor n=1 Tax=Actinomadura sp. OS1-43 TaxID=604315 RepID=UPI00255B2BE5|nr:sigma factor [Actinomadura sp. OS1-43]MDL4816498.1 sigma factor [Actinomadura sp. OS1-43]